MRVSRLVLLLNIAIIASLVLGGLSAALVGLTALPAISKLSIGNVSTSTAGTLTRIVVPVTLSNDGYLAIAGVQLNATLTDSSGHRIVTGGAGPVDVQPGQRATVPITLYLNASSIPPATLASLATSSQKLSVLVDASSSIPPFVSLHARVSTTMDWGAPVSGLQVGAAQVLGASSGTVEIRIPVSFTNKNSYFSVSGNATAVIYDQGNNQVGRGSISVDAPAGAGFNGTALIVVSVPYSLVQELLFNDTTLNYRAVITVESGGRTVFTLSQPIQYEWKAPLSHFSIGQYSSSYFNTTSFVVSLPISFTDGSPFFDVSGTVSATVRNGSSSQVLGSGLLTLNVSHGETFSGNLKLHLRLPSQYIQTLAFENRTLSYSVDVSFSSGGFSGSYTLPISFSWGAPVGSLHFGSFTVTGTNNTQATFSVPFSMTDYNSIIPVSGILSGTVYDQAGNQVGVVYQEQINAQPLSRISSSITGSVQLTALNNRVFVLHLTFTTQYGTFTKTVTING